MTGPKRHTRPPNKFRGTTLVAAAIVTTLVVALGVGTASAGLRDRRGGDGFNAAQRQQQQRGRGDDRNQNEDPAAEETADAPEDTAAADPTEDADPAEDDGQDDGGDAAPATGPVADDFIDIQNVNPSGRQVRAGRNGSSGTFNIQCGAQNDHHNSDNMIAAPGVTNGAHHLHDYTGNDSTDGNSTDESLAAAGTSCEKGDKSAYFWPVVRDITQTENQQRFPGELEEDLNVGTVLIPKFTIQFQGSPKSKVTAMPQFLRVLAGDAKASVNGGANAKSKYTCTGFGNRFTTDKYPLCPNGRGMTRIAEFPSCWDGENTDSANHRTHIVYPDRQGNCPSGTVTVPKLVITMVYNVPAGPSFAVDSFPESLHKPINDHNDFVNVMPEELMGQVVNCINNGQRC